MAWRIAESLKTLRAQINAAYPTRDKRSDGGIGDARHQSSNSDHNPWIKDKNGFGVVTAIDIDEDLAPDIHSIESIVKAIQKSKDPRVKYIIYEKRITVPGDITKWKPYHGKNPHDHHAHISVKSDPKDYDSTKPWAIASATPFANLAEDEIHLDIPDPDFKDSEAAVSQAGGGSTVENVAPTAESAPAQEPLAPPPTSNEGTTNIGSQEADVIANVGTTSTEAEKRIEGATALDTTHVKATEKTGFLSKIAVIISGIFTGTYVIPQGLAEGLNIWEIFKMIGAFLYEFRFWIGGALAVWFIVTKWESVTLKKKQIDVNTDPEKGDVVLHKHKGWIQRFRDAIKTFRNRNAEE